jgi:hypothetical protein
MATYSVGFDPARRTGQFQMAGVSITRQPSKTIELWGAKSTKTYMVAITAGVDKPSEIDRLDTPSADLSHRVLPYLRSNATMRAW